MNLEVGQRVGDYEVLGVLGRGGMGSVYKVRNIVSNRVEAMKLLHDSLTGDTAFGERFLREIRVLAEMKHPHIAGLLTAQRLEGRRLAMLMEFVEGQSLQALLSERIVPLDDAIRYACEVLDALGYAHERGVVHRDVKPANILIDQQNRVHLTDFGIARGADYQLTEAGNTVGSIHYMSPEQIRAEDLDGRSDIYAVGITLYEMATRRKPFEGQSHYSIMASHLNESPRPPIELDPTLPSALSEIILTAIQKDRNQRFGTAQAMRHALESLLETAVDIPAATAPAAAVVPSPPPVPVPAPPLAPTVELRHPASRRGLYMGLGALAAVAAIVVVALLAPHWGRTQAGPAQPASAASEPAGTVVTQSPAAADNTASVSPSGSPAAAPRTPGEPSLAKGTRSGPPAQTPPPAMQPAAGPVTSQQPPPQSPQHQQTPPEAAQGPAAATGPAAPAPARNAEVERLRDRLNTLAVRFGAVRQGLDNLKRQQAAMGLGTRSDFLSAERQTTRYFDEAEAALNAGDAAKAAERLNLAERSLSFLEEKLGR